MRSLTILLFLSACSGTVAPDAGTDAGPPPTRDGGMDAGDPPVVPDSLCPGGPDCADEGDGVLHAGAAALTITPLLDRYETEWTDVDGDAYFDTRDGDTFVDDDGDGQFDAIWMAGFGNARAAAGVADDQWARVVVLRQNETTIAFVALDVIGWFIDDADPIRELVSDLPIDFVVVSGTHVHEAFDTIGIWGVDLGTPGRDPAYIDYVQHQAADAIRAAHTALEPAHVQYASFMLRDQPGGTRRYVRDVRDPYILDDQMRLMRLIAADDDATIATVINFAAHPEYSGDENLQLTSDYPHWLRTGIERGVVGPDGTEVPGVGGVAVFINGALGSQIGPGGLTLEAWDGTPVDRYQLLAAETLGTQLAYYALAALGPDGGSVTDETADLGFRTVRFTVRVENRRYHIGFLNGIFARELFNFDPDLPIRPGNIPDLITEVSVIDVGRAQMLTAPGELDPALFVGGYDGSYTPDGIPVVDTSQENPPDLSLAPDPPYLRDLARDDADQVWLLGLTNDFLGYFVPPFDYQLHDAAPYLLEAPGDHYEETNSVGERAWPRIGRKLTELIQYEP
jgi:hypothetical protein